MHHSIANKRANSPTAQKWTTGNNAAQDMNVSKKMVLGTPAQVGSLVAPLKRGCRP